MNKSKVNQKNSPTNNIKTHTPNIIQTASSSVATPRVSDLDALMAEKDISNDNNQPHTIELKSTVVFPTPTINHIRRSLFSTDSVKVVRTVRSQELKLFSCHLTPDITTSTPSDEKSYESNTEEKYLNHVPSDVKPGKKSFDNLNFVKYDDSSSTVTTTTTNSTMTRDLSEDSLNEHYHIRKLLNTSKLLYSFQYISLKAIYESSE